MPKNRGDAVLTIVSAVGLTAVTTIVVGLLVGDGSTREWLLSSAGALELGGILLVASPELAPILRRLVGGLNALRRRFGALARQAAGWILTKLGRPRPKVVAASPA